MKNQKDELQKLADKYLLVEFEVRKLADILNVMHRTGEMAADFGDEMCRIHDWFANERIALLEQISNEEFEEDTPTAELTATAINWLQSNGYKIVSPEEKAGKVS